MDLIVFNEHFSKLVRRWGIDREVAFDYFEAVNSIPNHRFKKVVDRVFCEHDFLPKPQTFLDYSFEISRSEMERGSWGAIESTESKIAREVEDMDAETIAANRRRLAEMVRGLVAKTSVNSSANRETSEIDRINRFLSDPILRREAIAEIQTRDDLQPVFDEFGEIQGVRYAS